MRSLPTRRFRATAIVLWIVGSFAPAALAHHWQMENAALPVPFLRDGRVDVMIEPSGVAPIGDGRRVLAANDEAAALHVVDLATGTLVGPPLSSPKFPPTTSSGPKWAGMTVDSEGNYYLVGAHGGKSDDKRAASRAVVRFRLQGGDTPTIDDESVVRWDITRSLEAALRAQRLDEARIANQKIGGLAVREIGGLRQLVIGLSAPNDKVRAFAADITTTPLPDAELEIRPLFTFDAGRCEGVAAQLASLQYVPAMSGFLILTATEDADYAFHGNTLWLVADGETRRARQYSTFEVAMKAGGMSVLAVKASGHFTKIEVLITYDNDPHATRIPSRFQTVTLVHERD